MMAHIHNWQISATLSFYLYCLYMYVDALYQKTSFLF